MSAYTIGSIIGSFIATLALYRFFLWLATNNNNFIQAIIRHTFITLTVALMCVFLLNLGNDGDVSSFPYYLYSAVGVGLYHFITELVRR